MSEPLRRDPKLEYVRADEGEDGSCEGGTVGMAKFERLKCTEKVFSARRKLAAALVMLPGHRSIRTVPGCWYSFSPSSTMIGERPKRTTATSTPYPGLQAH